MTRARTRVILKLDPALAPIKVAILPLAKNKPEIVALAEIHQAFHFSRRCALLRRHRRIGKLYARLDEMARRLRDRGPSITRR